MIDRVQESSASSPDIRLARGYYFLESYIIDRVQEFSASVPGIRPARGHRFQVSYTIDRVQEGRMTKILLSKSGIVGIL